MKEFPSPPKSAGELTQDLLLCDKSIQTGQKHLLIRTLYIAGNRSVLYIVRGARHRLWGLLPPRELGRVEQELRVPGDIRTEEQLLQYLDEKKPHWL